MRCLKCDVKTSSGGRDAFGGFHPTKLAPDRLCPDTEAACKNCGRIYDPYQRVDQIEGPFCCVACEHGH